jgi:transposase
VVDVPSKLSARARVFSTGQGRKTDPVDAHSVAVVALRTNGLRQVCVDDTTVALRLLVDRRDTLGRARTELISRLHHLLLELVAGGAKKYLSVRSELLSCGGEARSPASHRSSLRPTRRGAKILVGLAADGASCRRP